MATDERQHELILLGQIKGTVEQLATSHQQLHGAIGGVHAHMEKLDERLRAVEQRAAVTGALSGGVMAVGVALLVEGLKQWAKGKS